MSKIFAVITDLMHATLADEKWEPVFGIGAQCQIEGGAYLELCDDDLGCPNSCLMILNHVDWPRMKVKVNLPFTGVLSEIVAPPSISDEIERCKHREQTLGCSCCFVKWWSKKADELNMKYVRPRLVAGRKV